MEYITPRKNGHTNVNLSNDEQCSATIPNTFNSLQSRYERVIMKIFAHYSIPLEITNPIRQTFKSKLQRMGMQFGKLGSKSRLIKLDQWKHGKNSVWKFVIDGVKLSHQLLNQKRKIEAQLNEEVVKRRKCEEEFLKLQKTISHQESSQKKIQAEALVGGE